MNKLFITLYDFFERRRALLCTVLAVLVAAMGAAALQLRFSENITGFFPDGERKAAAAFSNLKIKDKIAVMINTREGAEGTGATAEGMMACADRLVELLEADTLFHRWAQAEASFGSELVDDMRAFLQGHLPLLLTEADYARMDTLLTRQGIARAMESNYRRLLSPVGGFIDEYIYDDPLGLSFGALGKLQDLRRLPLLEGHDDADGLHLAPVREQRHGHRRPAGGADRSGAGRPERRVRRPGHLGRLLRRPGRGRIQRAADQARHDADAEHRHPRHRGVHHPLVPQQAVGAAGPDPRSAGRIAGAGGHVARVPHDLGHSRRGRNRRHGHRTELLDTHPLPCQPLPRPAADHPRPGLPADDRQHHDHRRLRRAAFHRLAATARLRALRFADTGRNDAVQPRPAAPPDP